MAIPYPFMQCCCSVCGCGTICSAGWCVCTTRPPWGFTSRVLRPMPMWSGSVPRVGEGGGGGSNARGGSSVSGHCCGHANSCYLWCHCIPASGRKCGTVWKRFQRRHPSSEAFLSNAICEIGGKCRYGQLHISTRPSASAVSRQALEPLALKFLGRAIWRVRIAT